MTEAEHDAGRDDFQRIYLRPLDWSKPWRRIDHRDLSPDEALMVLETLLGGRRWRVRAWDGPLGLTSLEVTADFQAEAGHRDVQRLLGDDR